MQKLIPTVSVDKFQNFAKSKEVIVAAVSFILTPIALTKVQEVLIKVPFLKENLTIGFILAGFLIFMIAFKMEGLPKTVLASIGAGVFVTAILSIGQIQETIQKVGLR